MIKLNFPLILIALILFLLSSCGGGSQSLSVPSSPSSEYESWKKGLPSTVEEFVENWKEIGKDWKCYWFDNLGSPSLSWEQYRNSTPEEIFQLKAINCHFGTKLLIDVYGGEYVYLPKVPYSHAIFLYQRNAKYYYVSFSGKSITLKELSGDRTESLQIIKEDFKPNEVVVGCPTLKEKY